MTPTTDVAITGDLARHLWVTALRWHVEDHRAKKPQPKRRARTTAQRRAK